MSKIKFLKDSLLVTSKSERDMISKWLNNKYKFSLLLYRGSRDGFLANVCHERID